MQARGKNGRFFALTALIAASTSLCSGAAHAAKEHHRVHTVAPAHAHAAVHGTEHAAHTSVGKANLHATVRVISFRHGRHAYNAAGSTRVASGRGISCVPFARNETGMAVAGNAADWWDNAAGVYERGSRPETGSVLNFRANSHMHLGHVAVVTDVLDQRHLVIDHANWSGPGARRGGVSRQVQVVDVSPENNWTAVRVELGHSGSFGSIYPTFGFIYNRTSHASADPVVTRPSRGNDPHVIAVAARVPTPVPDLNPAPRDLRPAAERAAAERFAARQAVVYDEVAEAPLHPRRALDLNVPSLNSGLNMDAPNRNLR